MRRTSPVIALLGAVALAGCSAGTGLRPITPTTGAPAAAVRPAPQAPAAAGGVTGSAAVRAAADGGSDVAILVRGLPAGVSYSARLAAAGCAQAGPGAALPGGVQLRFTTDASGRGSARAHTASPLRAGAARSLVVLGAAPPPLSASAEVGAGHLRQHLAEHGGGGQQSQPRTVAVACAALPTTSRG